MGIINPRQVPEDRIGFSHQVATLHEPHGYSVLTFRTSVKELITVEGIQNLFDLDFMDEDSDESFAQDDEVLKLNEDRNTSIGKWSL